MVGGLPHVIGLMATKNRARLAERAAAMFFRQDYEGRKLLVIFNDSDDGTFVECPNACVIRSSSPVSLPAKRNRMTSLFVDRYAIGFVWDDDDYHGPGRVRRQVAELTSSGRQGCAFRPYLHYDQVKRQVRRGVSSNPPDATLAFTRAFWDERPWDEAVDPGSGALMMQRRDLALLDAELDYVVCWHGAHRLAKTNTRGPRWAPTDVTPDHVDELLAQR